MPAKKPTKRKWPAQVKAAKTTKTADKTKQKKTTAAAKRNAIKMSGKDTRTYGHTMASGKRSQARRDAKR